MKIYWGAGAVLVGALILGVLGANFLHLKQPEFSIFLGLLAALGLGGAAAIYYFQSRADAPPDEAAAPPAEGGNSELDILIREANSRLAQSNASGGAGIANLPLIFIIGDRGMAKTSTVLNSGLEPELLAGQVYQEDAVAPTRAANVWFARGNVLVEAGGSVLGDASNWARLVKRLQPGKLKSIGKGTQSPRAVLLCFSLEAFAQSGGADAVTAAARYLQARLGDISQLLGISFPVYILFTKTDRVPFFHDFVNTLSNDEASQVFGATVPIRMAGSGIYAQEETQRLTDAFNDLFYSLCDKRTVFLPRENNPEMLPGSYEFPREFRKLRATVVQFMVDVCRPSQLRASPFLRGFYFSGVRPVVVSDAPAMPMLTPRDAGAGHAALSGATGMFRVGKQAERVAQQAVAGQASSRKVPQWMFLGHLFNDIILRDNTAMSASGASVKTSMARRVLLACLAGICLLYSVALLVSYFGNRSLETQALTAARGIPAAEAGGGALASKDALAGLETLRQSLANLTRYEDEGAPLKLRWGLYQGASMYPEVRRIYYEKFRQLLFGNTQDGLFKFLRSRPLTPGRDDDYGYAYSTLKGYLLTGPKYELTKDKNLQAFLAELLLLRWDANREGEIGAERIALAKKQFEFYSKDLVNGNPYPTAADEAAVKQSRIYLSNFSGLERVYQGLLVEAQKHGPSVTFNQKFAGSAESVTSAFPVAWAFTKEGADFMQKEMRKSGYGGEPWVLGDYAGQSVDKANMESGIRALYTKDFITRWRTVLKTSSVNRYADWKDAAEKLNQLTGSQAPLLALFWWTSQNTAIEVPGVAQAFRAVQTVEPSPAVQQYVVPANQPYNSALLKLQGTIAAGTSDPAALKGIKDDAQAARLATKQISASFPVDPEANIQSVVETLMLQPIVNLERLVGGDSKDELNKKGKAFCSDLGLITSKFPFNPGAQAEVTLPELNDIFRAKDGKLWVFYDAALKPVLQCSATDCTPAPNAPVAVSPAFIRFFSQAVRFSRALYGEAGTEPNFKYTLKPQKSDQIDQFMLTVNGDSSQLAGGAAKSFQWPGGPTRNLKLSLKLAGGTSFDLPSRDGLWSVFRFFADADRTTNTGAGYDFFWNFRQGQAGGGPSINGRPLVYEFNLETGGAPAVFSKDFLAGLKCVGTGAH